MGLTASKPIQMAKVTHARNMTCTHMDKQRLGAMQWVKGWVGQGQGVFEPGFNSTQVRLQGPVKALRTLLLRKM